ncbi:Hypothetical predicted protein [Podarcis lilfordi]|uniref:Uncharacterized protein n=1 Tax=Podarcis lilfordi TaxID=74358 RepID=A0AA35LBR0_9SAUR|nr:Hypothetical predicted protein [Podarcis lilfordi]
MLSCEWSIHKHAIIEGDAASQHQPANWVLQKTCNLEHKDFSWVKRQNAIVPILSEPGYIRFSPTLWRTLELPIECSVEEHE